MTRRAVVLTLLFVGVPMLALAYGCTRIIGSDEKTNAAVTSSLQSYLGKRGEVDSCQNAQFEQDGLRLFECVVYPAGDPYSAQTWNVTVNASDSVVDASRK